MVAVRFTFHELVMAVPAGRVSPTDQPVIGDEPAVTLTVATKPPVQELSETVAEQPPGWFGVLGDGDDGDGPGPDGDGDGPHGQLDLAQQCTLAAEALFVCMKLVAILGQCDRVKTRDRPARQQSAAVERERIGLAVITLESIAGRKQELHVAVHVAGADGRCELTGDVAIAGTTHSDVDFGEQVEVVQLLAAPRREGERYERNARPRHPGTSICSHDEVLKKR